VATAKKEQGVNCYWVIKKHIATAAGVGSTSYPVLCDCIEGDKGGESSRGFRQPVLCHTATHRKLRLNPKKVKRDKELEVLRLRIKKEVPILNLRHLRDREKPAREKKGHPTKPISAENWMDYN